MSLLASAAVLLALGQTPIAPSTEYPRYWAYDGKPVVLIGGSVEDNLFQIPDIEAHLDLLAASGGNYVRCTMSSRDEGNVWAFAQRDDGKYDLTKWNDEYWRRFETFLTLARDRGVIAQIELWDRFDYGQGFWERNPYRPANNVNYTVESSGLKNAYPNHPGSNENPFFYSVPTLRNNATVLPFQQAQVDRMLAISLRFPNVLYCMDNETSGAEEWGAYWAGYIVERAEAAGVKVYVTEMWDDWNLQADVHKRTLDRPDRYGFADLSQNNHQKGQKHWDNFHWAWNYVAGAPRPINNVKIYGADGGRFGNSRDGFERFWRALIGGAASVRFHRPDSGNGLGEAAQAHIKSARMLADAFPFFGAAPGIADDRIRDCEPNEAYVTIASDGSAAVYFPDGGAVSVAVSGGKVRWLDIAASAWSEPAAVAASEPEGWLALNAPGPGHWVALITP